MWLGDGGKASVRIAEAFLFRGARGPDTGCRTRVAGAPRSRAEAETMNVTGWTERGSPGRWALAAVAVGALALRLWHLGWGLPDLYEEATPLFRAWGFWNWGGQGLDLNPHFFNYPALSFLVQFLLQAMHAGVGFVAGAYPDLNAFQSAWSSDLPTVRPARTAARSPLRHRHGRDHRDAGRAARSIAARARRGGHGGGQPAADRALADDRRGLHARVLLFVRRAGR